MGFELSPVSVALSASFCASRRACSLTWPLSSNIFPELQFPSPKYCLRTCNVDGTAVFLSFKTHRVMRFPSFCLR